MASLCGNLTPRVGKDLRKTQRNEKKESNEKALGENFDALEKKIAEKEGIDMSDNVKEKPKIADDLEKRKIIDSENKNNCIPCFLNQQKIMKNKGTKKMMKIGKKNTGEKKNGTKTCRFSFIRSFIGSFFGSAN